MPSVLWQYHGSLGLKSASTLIRDTYDDTTDDVVPIAACISVSEFVEDDEDWN